MDDKVLLFKEENGKKEAITELSNGETAEISVSAVVAAYGYKREADG